MMVLKKIGYEISTEVLDLLFIRTIPWNYRGVNIVSLSLSFFLPSNYSHVRGKQFIAYTLQTFNKHDRYLSLVYKRRSVCFEQGRMACTRNTVYASRPSLLSYERATQLIDHINRSTVHRTVILVFGIDTLRPARTQKIIWRNTVYNRLFHIYAPFPIFRAPIVARDDAFHGSFYANIRHAPYFIPRCFVTSRLDFFFSFPFSLTCTSHAYFPYYIIV